MHLLLVHVLPSVGGDNVPHAGLVLGEQLGLVSCHDVLLALLVGVVSHVPPGVGGDDVPHAGLVLLDQLSLVFRHNVLPHLLEHVLPGVGGDDVLPAGLCSCYDPMLPLWWKSEVFLIARYYVTFSSLLVWV